MAETCGDARLDRIENKLDQIQEVLVTMARIEERQALSEDFSKNMIRLYEKLDERVDVLERICSKNSLFTSGIAHLGWVVVAALISAKVGGWV